jgi:SWI/SNF-related matrix-associated actin-dependent regulator of chromatin subfamily A3
MNSVVFSSWRDTLDILAAMLTAEGILFVQVDGRNPLVGRTELLSRFRLDPYIKVLLISINTGAVG